MVISGTKIRDVESKKKVRSRFRKNPDLELALRGLRSRERYQTPDLYLREKILRSEIDNSRDRETRDLGVEGVKGEGQGETLMQLRDVEFRDPKLIKKSLKDLRE